MLLVNQKQISDAAFEDEINPMHIYAKQYKKGIEYLKETYGDSIKFVRPGFPKKIKGLDPRGREVPNMIEPTAPMMIPLKAEVQGERGMEIWEYSVGSPSLLPNGLWKAGGRRSQTITEQLKVNLKRDPELAFFLYYKSPAFRSPEDIEKKGLMGLLKVDDPAAEAKLEGDKARRELDLNTALYSTLSDTERLIVVAQAYGIERAEGRHPDSLRKKLKEIVLKGDVKKRSDPTARGVKEFLEELKVTDSVRLRSLVQSMEDEKKIVWFPDGKYKVGERELCRVPLAEQAQRRDFLCNHLLKKANLPKLQDLLKDVVDKNYLDKLSDPKTFAWLARIMDLKYTFVEKEKVRELIYECFVLD